MRRPATTAVTLPFGATSAPYSASSPHIGVDFSSVPDNKIYAPEAGTVELHPDDGTCGRSIHMFVGPRHHAFCHTSQYLVANGQQVSEGQPIAVMGQTGYAFGVHLHWALKINNQFVDPLTQVTQVAQGGEDVIHDADNEYARWRQVGWYIRGRELSRDEFRASAVGQSWLRALEILCDNAEATNTEHAQEIGQLAIKDKWDQQIYDLQARVKELEAGQSVTQEEIDQLAAMADNLGQSIRKVNK